MEVLAIKGESNHLSVWFDPNKGILSLKGLSLPENALDFFLPLFNWVEEYKKLAQYRTQVLLNFKYLDEKSAAYIAKLIDSIQQLEVRGKDISFFWYYHLDDTDMKDLALSMFGDSICKFQLIRKQDDVIKKIRYNYIKSNKQ